jgi:arylsulfatase
VLQGRDRGRYIEAYRAYATAQGFDLVAGNIENLTERDITHLRQPGKAPCGTAEIPLEHFLETWQTTQFLERLDARPDDRPFFAICSFNAPHFPMIVPAPYDTLVDPASVSLPESLATGLAGKPREVAESHYAYLAGSLDEGEWRRLIAHYLGLCALVDAQVGRILAHLADRGLADSTIVAFTADHGDMLGAHGLFEKGYPLHYEETLRIPLVVADPAHPTPSRPEGLVSLMDVVPTLADLAGVPLAPDSEREGHSVAGAINGGSAAAAALRPFVLAETFAYGGVESGGGQYVDPARFADLGGAANLSLRTPDARYVFRWNDVDEYYDLATDAHELHNVVGSPEYAPAVEAARSTILAEVERTDARFAAAVRQRLAEKAVGGAPGATGVTGVTSTPSSDSLAARSR